MLCTAISMTLCGLTPLQATDNTDLEQAVGHQVAAKQHLKSQGSDKFAQKMIFNLLKAHNGNAEKAVEDFAGAPIFQDSPLEGYSPKYMLYTHLPMRWIHFG